MKSLRSGYNFMKPTKKSPAIENLLSQITGANRQKTITDNRCVPPPIGCGGPATEFRNDLSRREYSISGLCQKCQDTFFGRD